MEGAAGYAPGSPFWLCPSKPSCDGSPGVLTLFFVGDRAQRLRALGEHGRRTL
jgi:hypothetical protein